MFAELHLAAGYEIERILEIEKVCFPCPWTKQQITTCVESPFYRTWTAKIDGIVQGYISAALTGDRLHILNLAVSEDHRRIGMGRMLLDAAEGWGSRLGSACSILEVRRSSDSAINLYTAAGYTNTHLLPDYYPDGEEGLKYTKVLVPDTDSSHLATSILRRCECIPPVGVILGSGLSWLAGSFGSASVVPYSDLPGHGVEILPGHPGELIFSRCGRFVFLLGRRHVFQGYSADELAILPGVLGDLGVSTWVLTSSSGAVDPNLECGDCVLLSDHVNCSGCVPSSPAGRTSESIYSTELRHLAMSIAGKTNAPVREGVFACVSGPAYETSTELGLLRERGVSSVSMSTAPEALLLSSRGFDVVAFSLITNTVTPGAEVTHDQVLAAQVIIRKKQGSFLTEYLERVADRDLL